MSLENCHVPGAVSFEIILIINGRDQETEDFVSSLEGKMHLKVLQCSMGTPAFARNRAIEKAKGEWILFLDDDIELPSNYFHKAFQGLERIGAKGDVLGGPDLLGNQATPLQTAYSFCQAHPFITAHTRYRHFSRQSDAPFLADESKLILCNLWVRREIFEQGFHFPEGYQRNEENVFLHQLLKAGKNLFY